MVKKLFKSLLVTVLVLIAIMAGVPWALYLYGLQALPSDTSPAKEPVPPVVLKALWISETTTTTMVMEPISFWAWSRMFIDARLEAFPPSFRVASLAGRMLVNRDHIAEPRRVLVRGVRELAAALWISQHWTAEDAVRTILVGSYFGHGFYGLSRAAQGYFGLQTQELSIDEATVLVGLVRNNRSYDPWCQPEHCRAFAEILAARLKQEATFDLRLLPAPAGACN